MTQEGYIHMSALALGVPPSRWRVFTHAKNSHFISVKDALKIYERDYCSTVPFKYEEPLLRPRKQETMKND